MIKIKILNAVYPLCISTFTFHNHFIICIIQWLNATIELKMSTVAILKWLDIKILFFEPEPGSPTALVLYFGGNQSSLTADTENYEDFRKFELGPKAWTNLSSYLSAYVRTLIGLSAFTLAWNMIEYTRGQCHMYQTRI